jgi:histone acetyltransferase 1
LFIEAGSYIDDEDDHWELFLLYRKTPSGISQFAGFCTVYQYFWFKTTELHDASNNRDVGESFTPNLRKRISQFVILPTHQGRGVGGAFYETLVQIFLRDKAVREISVEDPSEAFDDLRDRCDLIRLYENGTWTDTDLIRSVRITPEWIEATRERNKMTPRQFDRCLEMALLKFADLADPAVARRYRLLVKKRLYLRNKEPLDEMSKEEKKEKLEETFEILKEDYLRILSKVKFDKKRTAVTAAEEETTSLKKQKV